MIPTNIPNICIIIDQIPVTPFTLGLTAIIKVIIAIGNNK